MVGDELRSLFDTRLGSIRGAKTARNMEHECLANEDSMEECFALRSVEASLNLHRFSPEDWINSSSGSFHSPPKMMCTWTTTGVAHEAPSIVTTRARTDHVETTTLLSPSKCILEVFSLFRMTRALKLFQTEEMRNQPYNIGKATPHKVSTYTISQGSVVTKTTRLRSLVWGSSAISWFYSYSQGHEYLR